MKSRRILCMTALMLAMLLAMGGCKQAEAKEASTQPAEQVEETEETTEEPTIGESTEEELKAEAAAKAEAEKKAAEEAAKAEAEKKAAEEAAKAEAEKKAAEEAAAKAEAEKKAAEEAAAKAEAEKKAAEEAAKAEKETVTAQAETTTSGDGAVEAATPAADTANSDDYALNEYGNPSYDVWAYGLVDTVNPSDPEIAKFIGVTGYKGSTRIPNPLAKIDPVSPFIGMKNPPADWPKPTPMGAGEYKWDSETGCWRYYNDMGKATEFYMSLYGQKTMRSSEMKNIYGSEYSNFDANNRGVY